MIEVKHLTKRYGAHIAVSDLSFSIERGVIYGFLGPNGAGKSTTMNIITGCLGATDGTVSIDGNDIGENPMKAKRLIGYLPEQPPLYMDMTPAEYLSFVAAAKGIPRSQRDEQLRNVMRRTGIELMQKRLIRNLSKGYKQRVGIAQALLGDPEVIILDEPTVGLDPAQIIEIRELIRELGQKHTIVLSSHILSEVQAVCQSIMIISKGRLVASDTAENLTALFKGQENIRLEAHANEAEVSEILESVAGIEDIRFSSSEADCLVAEIVSADGRDLREAIFRAFAASDIPLLELHCERASLEDVFLELTQEDANEETNSVSQTEHEEASGQ